MTVGAFCLIATAPMIEAAIVPFQFWLADAHAVAPSPVSVIFSGALSQGGTGGILLYLVGHGLVKGALFMVAGILLATRGGIDEVTLRGRGRGIMPAGFAMGLGEALLCGLPLGLLDQGSRVLKDTLATGGHPVAASVVGSGLTGAAVLRAAERIFLGLGPDPGDEAQAPSQAEREKTNRPLWLMLAPCLVLLALNLAAAEGTILHHAAAAVPDFTHAVGEELLPGPEWLSWAGLILALVVATFDLGQHRFPAWLRTSIRVTQSVPTRLPERVHSGPIGDYATWLAAGLTILAALLAMPGS